MNSVQRTFRYIKIIPENYQPSNWTTVTNDWPQEGNIVFNNVVLSYSASLPVVLKGVSFSVLPRQKIGICGRTGAGKSSLITALFRLAELSEGSIEIDGVDISRLQLQDLRARISIIPQDPILFRGTIRSNLDPFSDYEDVQIWNTLERINLKSVVECTPQKLEAPITENGDNFSVGQRQLMCLGRALLRKTKLSSFILVLDEATASVDLETDKFIQASIKKEFSDCTVLTIAHRLDTIIESDKVLLMEDGKVAEFDSPHSLLSDPNSLFFNLVNQTGNAAHLSLLARRKSVD